MRASIVCPQSGEAISFEVKSDAASVMKGWNRTLKLTCPHCANEHRMKFKHVYIEGVLASFTADVDRFGLAAPSR